MNPTIRFATCALALGFLAPAWAINKCTDARGRISFQDAPCAGEGEKIEVRPALPAAAPASSAAPPAAAAAAAPAKAPSKEGAFGPTWQRKHYLQNQGVPQARAAMERNQRECAAPPDEAVAQAGPLRRSLGAGSQFAQENAAAARKAKAACDARTLELRDQLKALEDELGSL
ncbi:DUF4124 domain-containing protein [Paracidovorax sp. MALMAid1276]|uniref:DUF4124 domain-containing protein n=1 Tax=Paracidovorax sp. MALMAid1276 TaxID=3411631 RepID=UPI003B9C9D5F